MSLLMGMVAVGADVCRQPSCLAGPADNGAITIKVLRCEYAKNPLGIDTPAPRFSWILESNQRGQMQTAYRILVASSTQKINPDIADKWDSGKVNSDKSVNVPYEGKVLSSGEKYFWKVRVWDKNGKSSTWSKPATFTIGLLKESDWQGKWIGRDTSDRESNYKVGRFEQAIQLNGKSECIKIPYAASLFPAEQITLSLWIKPDDISGTWREIYRSQADVGSQAPHHLFSLGEGNLYFGLSLGGGTAAENYRELSAPLDHRLTDGQWHLITATYDGSVKKIYVDGVEKAWEPATGVLATTLSPTIYLGATAGNRNFFQGGIDDVRVYRRALSPEEIRALAKGSGEIETDRVGYWKMDGDLTNSAGDEHSKGIKVGTLDTGSPLLRKEFKTVGEIKRAMMYLSGLGWYELYLNGKKVGDHVLDPAWTSYDKRVFYVTYDVTDLLKKGRNVIGVMLGNGFYSQRPIAGFTDVIHTYGESPKLLLQMNVECADGSTTSINSDRTWKASDGPITSNNIVGGEVYDARLEKEGWTEAGYDDSTWAPVVIKEPPGGKMESQLMPAIKVNQTLKPIKLTHPQPGIYVYDLGQHFGGWARMHVKGPRGTKITIKHSSRIYADTGLINKEAFPGIMETDYYIVKGDPQGETYEPKFTFHPTRYVQIEGYPGVPTINDIEGRVVYTSADMSGDFECSNALLNQVHRIAVWTLTNELYGLPLDSLHREPGAFICPENMGNLYTRKNMPLFWTKWLRDISLDGINGMIPFTAPDYRHTGVGHVAYSGNYPILVWYVYQYYDDRRILQEHYSTIKAWVDYLTSKADDHIINADSFGDHMVPGPEPGKEEFMSRQTPRDLCQTGYYYRNGLILAHIAKILGQSDDAEHYAKLAESIKTAINTKWLNRQTSQYAVGSQTSNLFPLALGIVPEENKTGVVRNIVENIMKKYNGHLHTGNIGTNALIDALTAHGGGEAMYSAATRTTYPGWGYMIEQGATTIWEAWGREWKTSKRKREESMVMFATIDGFFYNYLAGIQAPDYYGPGYMPPGFRYIQIKPYVLGDLTYASGFIRTVRGMISASWKRTDDSLTLEVAIPVNSQARISVPKIGLQNVTVTESEKAVWKNGTFIPGISGITKGNETEDYVMFETGSGSYRFRLQGQR